MYSIGKFSRITGVSTKTLIWYDSIGLFKPDFVNEENGYRYYTADSIKRLANIQYFQSLDFSINEIMNLSDDVISNKIVHLKNKIDYIEANIPFLEKLKEKAMNENTLSIYDIQKSKEHQARIQGKWAFALATNDFAEAISTCIMKTKPKDMPKELFFGENQSGTDSENILYYSLDKINIKEKTYTFLIMNLDENLILFEKPDSIFDENAKDKKLYFYVYKRLNQNAYTRKDLEKIMKKAEYRKPKMDAKFCEYDNHFDGTWRHIDNIKESEINSYSGKDKKDNFNILYPMFDRLTFSGKEVAVMGEDDSFTVGNKTYTYENSKMKLCVYPNDTFIVNPILNVRQKVYEKIVDGKSTVFVNFTNELDTNENTTVYVYQKGE